MAASCKTNFRLVLNQSIRSHPGRVRLLEDVQNVVGSVRECVAWEQEHTELPRSLVLSARIPACLSVPDVFRGSSCLSVSPPRPCHHEWPQDLRCAAETAKGLKRPDKSRHWSQSLTDLSQCFQRHMRGVILPVHNCETFNSFSWSDQHTSDYDGPNLEFFSQTTLYPRRFNLGCIHSEPAFACFERRRTFIMSSSAYFPRQSD